MKLFFYTVALDIYPQGQTVSFETLSVCTLSTSLMKFSLFLHAVSSLFISRGVVNDDDANVVVVPSMVVVAE